MRGPKAWDSHLLPIRPDRWDEVFQAQRRELSVLLAERIWRRIANRVYAFTDPLRSPLEGQLEEESNV